MNFHEFSTLAKWFGCSTADVQKMIANNDWCMWRKFEEKVMEDNSLFLAFCSMMKPFADSQFYDHAIRGYLLADLPARARALFIAYQSVHERK